MSLHHRLLVRFWNSHPSIHPIHPHSNFKTDVFFKNPNLAQCEHWKGEDTEKSVHTQPFSKPGTGSSKRSSKETNKKAKDCFSRTFHNRSRNHLQRNAFSRGRCHSATDDHNKKKLKSISNVDSTSSDIPSI